MITKERARELRSRIEKMVKGLSDEDALEVVELFPGWRPTKIYSVGDRVQYNGILYRVLQNHTSQSDWTPDISISLFAEVLIPDPDLIPEWVQPESTNPYMIEDKVKHNGKIWISTIDYNVYEPGVYGWNEVEQ